MGKTFTNKDPFDGVRGVRGLAQMLGNPDKAVDTFNDENCIFGLWLPAAGRVTPDTWPTARNLCQLHEPPPVDKLDRVVYQRTIGPKGPPEERSNDPNGLQRRGSQR